MTTSSHNVTDGLRTRSVLTVDSPEHVVDEIPITAEAVGTAVRTRAQIHETLTGSDHRLIVVVGPCSIHDPAAALDYARRLAAIKDKVSDALLIVMRVYFEKPRTTVGWKGLINDPGLDESYRINDGLRIARRLLMEINGMGLAAGTEYLDLISPQYISDLVSWGAIGARTTESQCHREMASGLSCPVGFKNGTDGNLKIAIDAIRAANHPHQFLGVTKGGQSAIFETTGNEDCHIILRGGSAPNYDEKSVNDACAALASAKLREQVMIDLSHANSAKQHERQMIVAEDVCNRISAGETRIVGCMIESNLVAGRQDIVAGEAKTYGQSVTDACIDWANTETVLEQLANAVRSRSSA